MAQDLDKKALLTAKGDVFNQQVKALSTALNGADQRLVDLVVAAARRWFSIDSGSNNVMENLVKLLADFPLMQEKTVLVLGGSGAQKKGALVPVLFEESDTQEGVYKLTTKVKLSALSAEAKAEFMKAIDDFEALNLKRITDYGKKAPAAPTFKAVKLAKIRDQLSDKAATLIATALLSDSKETLDTLKNKLANTISEITQEQVDAAKEKILAKKPLAPVKTTGDVANALQTPEMQTAVKELTN